MYDYKTTLLKFLYEALRIAAIGAVTALLDESGSLFEFLKGSPWTALLVPVLAGLLTAAKNFLKNYR